MGIPYYVASLLKSHKHIQQKVTTRIDVDCLGVDFNCFIHAYLRPENPIGSIVVAFHKFITDIVRAKKVYVAFDGLVPYAKMVQQRYRRMRKGETGEFDKHQISPGTPFMKELAKTLRFMYPEVVVSDTMEPGEGEHKIFTWLRTQEERSTTCIYGLDADLVVIALAQSHLSAIQLLREQENGQYQSLDVNALKAVLPVDVDTFVRMSLQFGNDFLPNLAMFSLRQDGYSRALYHVKTPATAEDEQKVLLKRATEKERKVVAPDGRALEQRLGCHLMDGVINWEPVCYAYRKTVAWTYHYFTTSEVLDWNWVYPYPEAPLLATLEEYDAPESFVWDAPQPTMTVEEQLQFILPEASLATAGGTPAWADELYDEETETRVPWLRRFAWEADPWVSLPMGQLTVVSEYHLPQIGSR
jgi:5'-3' exonuclease